MLKFRKSRPANTLPLAEAPVCAISVDIRNRVIDSSADARPLIDAWDDGEPALFTLVDSVRENRSVADARLVLENGTRYSLTGVAIDNTVLVTAKDTTVNDRMMEALLQSRSLFKSLLDRAVDLSFEVDDNRIFRFLSPSEAFGHSLDAWVGRKAEDLFWCEGKVPARNPLSSRSENTFESVPVNFGNGYSGWVTFSVEPVHDDDGKFNGVRGVCRDVSDQVADGRQTRMDNLRLALQQRIVNLLNTAHTYEKLLDSASTELMEVLRADQVWSVVKFPEGLVPAAISGEGEIIPHIDYVWQQLEQAEAPVIEVEDDGEIHLVVRLDEGGSGIGMLVICRDASSFPWSDHEKSLLEDILGSLAAAFGKAQLINRLERLSSIDELTGIMNRRAFVEAVDRRLLHQARSGQSGCLLFVDLDHFKEVNDTLGHKAGDSAIKMVASTMQALVRACDIVGRYGGDEFVMWLEDISPANAALKARSLIDAMPGIREQIGAGHLRLSASVGVCASVPGLDRKFADMSERADAALYEVKNAGRGNVALAPAPNEDRQAAGGAI